MLTVVSKLCPGMKNNSMRRFFLLSLCFAAPGLLCIGIGSYGLHLAQQSTSWAKAPAKVVQSEVITSVQSRSGRGKTVLHKFNISYQYKVANQMYVSNNIFYGGGISTNTDFAEKYVTKYPQGMMTIATYDSLHPDQAVLEPGVKKLTFFPLVMGSTFFFIAITLMLIAWLEKTGSPLKSKAHNLLFFGLIPHFMLLFWIVF
jgi:Protein of unknown function (DUF3592)